MIYQPTPSRFCAKGEKTCGTLYADFSFNIMVLRSCSRISSYPAFPSRCLRLGQSYEEDGDSRRGDNLGQYNKF